MHESQENIQFSLDQSENQSSIDALTEAFEKRFQRVCSITVGIDEGTNKANIHVSLPPYLEQDERPNYPLTDPADPIRVQIHSRVSIDTILKLLEKPMDELFESER